MGVSAVLATVTAGVYLGWHTPELTTRPGETPGARGVGDRPVPAERAPVRARRPPASGRPRRARRRASAAPRLRRAREPDRDPLRFAWVFVVIACAEGDRETRVELASRRLLSPGPACAARCRSRPRSRYPSRPTPAPVSRTCTHPLPHLLGHPGDARRAGADHAARGPRLRLEDDGVETREDAKARIHAAEAALARLEVLAEEDWVRDDTAERMRGAYRFRTTASARASTTETTARSRSAPRTTSGSGANCSTRNETRSPLFGAPARSRTTSGSGWPATSTSKTSASTSEPAASVTGA